MSDQPKTLILAAGGTGGHIVPALRLGQAAVMQGYSVIWIAGDKPLEKQWSLPAGIIRHHMAVKALRGQSLSGFIKNATLMIKAFRNVYQLIASYDHALVICFGGYVSLPVGIAARIQSKTLLLHESNSVLGMTNRVLMPFANQCFMGLCIPQELAKHPKMCLVGNPMPNIQNHPNNITPWDGNRPLKILVLGGSQGAKNLSQGIIDACKEHRVLTNKIKLTIQTGHQHQSIIEQICQHLSYVHTIAFIDDIFEALSQYDLIIARAGAMTVSELMTAKKPCIFVPFYPATDQHQWRNAQCWQQQNCARIIHTPHQRQLVKSLASHLNALISKPQILQDMATCALEHTPHHIHAIDELLKHISHHTRKTR